MSTNNNSTELEIIVVEPKVKKANAAIIWLHGLGAEGGDFVALTEELGLPEDHRIRFLFPNAPVRSITVNDNMRMRGWYDIYGLNINAKEDTHGIQQSAELINELIHQEINSGITSNNIILAGFSQGGAISLYTGIRHPLQLGGIIALSSYLPLAKKSENELLPPVNAKIPIFMAHGIFDPVVPFSVGQDSYEYLTELTYNVQWSSYPMQHTLCLEEVNDIGHFIRSVLSY